MKSFEQNEILPRKDKRVEYHHKRTINLAQNFNRGFEVAKNDWLLFLCDDDGLFPEAFKGLINFLMKNWPYYS